jgi:putrescine aminotransferase
MKRNLEFDTAELQASDNYYLHPWEDLQKLGQNKRTIIGRAEGVYVYDTDENKLLDGPGGMWCVNVGHGREEIVQAVADQMRKMTYNSPWSLSNAPAAELADKLRELTPGDLNHVFYTTCGSTAVDSALRFCLFYNSYKGRPEKRHIISRENAYHGSTYLSGSCSGKERDKTFMTFETETVHHISAPHPYRRPEGMSVEDFKHAKVKELEDKILELGADKVACFIAEPILASGGVMVPPEGYQKACLEVCRRHDVLYISDEVVTGFGRLGHFFASEAVFGIVPDIITSAKGLTSGYVPMGAFFVSDRLLEEIGGSEAEGSVFSNGFTYSGHPVASAAALKNIEIMERENMMEHVREVGPYFQARLQELRDLPIVGDVRGMGLMACVECVISEDSKDPLMLDYEVGNRIDKHCQSLGLIVRPAINMCVMSPPLPITRAQIDELVGILRKGIELTTVDLRKEGLWND